MKGEENHQQAWKENLQDTCMAACGTCASRSACKTGGGEIMHCDCKKKITEDQPHAHAAGRMREGKEPQKSQEDKHKLLVDMNPWEA